MSPKPSTTPAALPLLVGASLLLGACDGCGGTPRAVPFKRNEAVSKRDGGAGREPPDAAAVLPVVNPLPQPQSAVEIGGFRITLPEHQIWASVDVDLDADGKQDALLLSTDASGAVRLHAFVADERASLQSAGDALELWSQPGCETTSPRAKALSAKHLLVEAHTACSPPAPGEAGEEEPQQPAPDGVNRPDPYDLPSPDGDDPAAPSPDAPAGEGTARVHAWIVAIGRAPRRLESLSLPADDSLSGTFSGTDSDGDGHADVRMDLSVRMQDAGDPEHLAITWLNRPSGLGRDPAQPEGALLALAEAARGHLRRAPERAEATARRVLQLHGALCQGGEQPLLEVGGVTGLPCGRSIARPRAVSVLVAALAKRGRLVEALAQREELVDSATQDIRKVDRERADRALESFPQLRGYSITRGPALPALRRPEVHAPRLRFDGEARVVVTAPTRATYSLATGMLSPGEGASSGLLESPDHRFAVTEVFRSCQGYRLRIVQASQIIAGVPAGDSVSEPLLLEAAAPAGASCPNLPTGMRNDDGGFRVLRWSGGGVVVMRRGRATAIPMGDDGKPSGPLLPLSQERPADLARHVPAPLRNHIPIITRLGIALLDLNKGQAQLLRMDDALSASDIAVSPSGARIAFVRGGHLWIAQPGTPKKSAPQDAGVPQPPTAP